MAKKGSIHAPGTKERLLEAAIDVFGRHRFDSATTRMIANVADIAAISYYLGSKGAVIVPLP